MTASKEGVASNLRIQPELNLDYPQSDIAEIQHDEETGTYNITTTFFGLYGVSSPLPGSYTEDLLDDEWDEYSCRKSFLDVIHNHIYPRLYQAWLKYKYAHNVVEFENHKYGDMVFDLIGLSDAYRDKNKKYGYLFKYAGILSQRNKSLAGLKTLLKECLPDAGIDIKPCIERKVELVKEQQCLLGEQNATLDQDACIGAQVADRGGKFEIEIGPLNKEQFSKFSNSKVAMEKIRDLVKIYLVQPLEFSVNLLLDSGAASPAKLGETSGSVIGVNCWVASQSNAEIERIEWLDNQRM